MKWIIKCRGHKNIKATHYSTLEFTKDEEISERADCIVGVKCDKSLIDLPKEFKEMLKKGERFYVKIYCEGVEDILVGKGHSGLLLTHPKDIVIRKSEYIDERTLLVKADKSALDLNRKLVEKLKNSNSIITIEIGPVV